MRERLELVEGILKANSHHLESMLSQKVKTQIASAIDDKIEQKKVDQLNNVELVMEDVDAAELSGPKERKHFGPPPPEKFDPVKYIKGGHSFHRRGRELDDIFQQARVD